jgi:long-chain acyl-CoA synthetase
MAKNYPYYPYHSIETFPEMLDLIQNKYAGNTILTQYTADGVPMTKTGAEFTEEVSALAAALADLRMAGKQIAVLADSGIRWVIAVFAITCTGGIAVAIDTEHPFDIIQRMLRCADAEGVICSDAFTHLFQPSTLDKVFPAIQIGGQAESAVPLYDSLIKSGKEILKAGKFSLKNYSVTPEQPAMIVYTSGTTSTAKPVQLTHRNLISNANLAVGNIDMGRRIFDPLPLYHTYGFVCGVLAHIAYGKSVCIGGDLKTMLRDIGLFAPDSLTVVPLILEAIHTRIIAGIRKAKKETLYNVFSSLYKAFKKIGIRLPSPFKHALAASFGKNLSMMVCGGAYMNPRVAMEMEALGIRVMQGYGITECSPLIAVNRNLANKPASVGQPLDKIEVKIAEGEILVKGPSVMKGYYKSPELTAEAFSPDGWFMTGDLGYKDKDGFLYITGRKKNLIVFKNGKKVTPEEIENSLSNIPLIAECMAYGAKTGESTDDVMLALMVFPDADRTKGMSDVDILQALQKEIAVINRGQPAYKQIQTIRIKDKPFEKNSLKKIIRVMP